MRDFLPIKMKKFLFIIGLLCYTLCLSAQTLSEARTMFTNGEYEKSLPIFAKELKRKPNDYALNYWYGACLYQTNQQKEAIPYLTKGEKGKIKEASYYLAEYAFQHFDFDQCMKHLDIYILYATGKHSAEIAYMLKTAEKINKMIDRVEEVVFIDSIIVPEKELLNHLPLHPACGSIFQMNMDDFGGKDSLKYQGYAYSTEKHDIVYFSDSTQNNGLDIFILSKLLDGWQKENPAENINQASNECNPYLLSDGITIYFASDGHNSIGGYDLFISRYNAITGAYFNPEPLPMPFNSSYNDYFYILDEQIGRGYLVSDRNQTPDSLIIYTFLPNEVRKIYQDKTRAELINLSKIHSIVDTQKGWNIDSIRAIQDSLYQKSLQLQDDTAQVTATDEEKHFFVRDSLVYFSESDFQSEDAKIKYNQYLKMKSRYRNTQQELESYRKKYAEMPEDDPNRKSLGDKIIQTEWSQLFLERDIPLKEYEIRQLEINTLENHTK